MSLLVHALTPEALTAQKDRLYATILLNEGVVGVAGGSFRVQEDTGSNLSCRIGSGTVGDKAVVGGDSTADQGNYVVLSSDPTDTVAVSAGDPSNPRIDRVGILVQDDEADSSGQSETILTVVEGTPSSSPSAPAEPDNFLTLALVEVAAQASAVTNGDITDMRVEARVKDSALPAHILDVAEVAAGTAASLTLNVPLGYEGGVRIFGQGRASESSRQALWFRINGDSGSNYLAYRISVIDAGSVGGSFDVGAQVVVGAVPGSSDTADRFGTTEIVIPRVSGPGRRHGQFKGVGISSGSAAIMRDGAFAWSTGAITSVTLLPALGSFVVGTRFELVRY